MKTHFVFVDFENVQPENLSLLHGGPYKIKVFLGSHQTRIPLAMARALQVFGTDVEYLQIDGNGKNALDFHIAYYIGRLAAENPDACFHVVSNDTGFDPLLSHLRAQGILCYRPRTVGEIPALTRPGGEMTAPRVDAIVNDLARRKAGRPRTIRTLRSAIKALFVNQVGDEDLDGIVEQLTARGVVRVANGRVHYELPAIGPSRTPHLRTPRQPRAADAGEAASAASAGSVAEREAASSASAGSVAEREVAALAPSGSVAEREAAAPTGSDTECEAGAPA